MQNLHDDNHLDELSRRAAEEFEPDHELHSWDKLRPALDAALPQKKERKRRFLFWIFLFLLVGGGAAYFTLWNEGGSQKMSQKPEVVVPSPAAPVENKKEKLPVVKTAQQPIVVAEISERKQQPLRQSSIDLKSITKTDNSKITQDKPQELKTEEIKSKTEDAKTEQPKIEQPKEDELKKEELKKEQPASTANAKKEEPKKEQPAPPVAKKENKTPSVSKNRWEFGLAVAPDVSTVKFTHSQDPGSNIGLTIGYNISRRFQIQTGVFYTSKNYKSYGKDYHPPKGYWTDYVKLETVTGECNMWDVPVNLRYNIVPRQSSNFFASAGLSSYFMKKEDYDFFYYYNGNPVNRFRSYYTDTKHWFAVMNLSLGYERQMSKHVSLQAEPFFKQPLKGLGFVKVKLNSTGIYFSVKYKLQSAKK